MKYNEFLKMAKAVGCSFVSHGKEHDVWQSKDGTFFRVPRHGNKEVSRGLLVNLMKKAGLK
jgi:predicted RNA binding protein YcfA (HicA-like mRNA interferase family)